MLFIAGMAPEGEPPALLAPSGTQPVGTRVPRGYARAAMAT
jgi:hypothetical protein